MTTAEIIAKEFHIEYERQALNHGYETRPESAVEWQDVPENNRKLMISVTRTLLERGIIKEGRVLHAS